MRSYSISILLAGALVCGISHSSSAQAPGGYAPANSPTTAAPASGYERLSGRNNPAASYFGGGHAIAFAPQPRPVPLPPPMPVPTARMGKPFTGFNQATSVSPYLALDARESEMSIPNYFLYVKPQLDQQRLNQAQQAQYYQMQKQLGAGNAGVVTASAAGSHTSRFMNMGGYYPGKR